MKKIVVFNTFEMRIIQYTAECLKVTFDSRDEVGGGGAYIKQDKTRNRILIRCNISIC